MNVRGSLVDGFFVPNKIWESEDLSWMEKCLVSVVIEWSYGHSDGCDLSNTELANIMGSTTQNMATTICRLRAMGLIEDVKFDGRTRWIRIILK